MPVESRKEAGECPRTLLKKSRPPSPAALDGRTGAAIESSEDWLPLPQGMMRHSEETISCDWDSEHALFRCYGPPEEEEAWLDEENLPGMLDELIEAAKKLTGDADEDGKTGLCGPGTHAVPVQGTIEVWFAPVVWHFGGGLCDQEVQMAAFASEAIGREDR